MEKNIFGTDGIRAKVGEDLLTQQGLLRLADALGQWVCHTYGNNIGILLAHDTRISAGFVKSVLKSGLLRYPVTIFDAQVLTTPAVFNLIQHDSRFALGIIISASHNPFYDNGIKIINRSTGKISVEDELLISRYVGQGYRDFDYSVMGTDLFFPEAQQLYSQHIQQFFPPHFLAGKKVVLDCAHGAASYGAPSIFERMGAQVIALNNNPTGTNINHECGALHPAHVQKAVVEHQADIGFAFDGDADRVIAINKKGVLKNGDDILALLLTNKTYESVKTIVGTVMTNKGFERHVEQQGKTLVRTPVGDKYIAAQIKAHNWLLGGEPSGHIIAADYLATGDGVFVALKIMETLYQTGNWDFETFELYPQVLINVPVQKKRELELFPASDIITYYERMLHSGRVLVRYSGTEPLLRIMVEDDDYDHARSVGMMLAQKLQQVLV